MNITNFGTMGIVFNYGTNFGVQTGLVVAGATPGSTLTGLVVNQGYNYGAQTGASVWR